MDVFKIHYKRVNVIILVVILCLNLCLTGCLDKNEIETFAYVTALGIDLNKEGKPEVSVQILDTGNKTASETGMMQITSNVYLYSGNTIYDALFNISKTLSKPLKFSNEKCIVLSQSYAENGIKSIIDLNTRFTDIRETTPLLVTAGRAVDILKASVSENRISAFVIEDLIKRQRQLGFTSITTSLDFVNSMVGKSDITTCGVINIDKTNLPNAFILSGSAVFRKDKLIGYMNAKETRGMQWIKGKVKLGSIVIETPDKMSVHIAKAKSSVKPSISDKKVTVNANIKVTTSIQEISSDMSGAINFNDDPNIIEQLNKKQDAAIYNEVNSAINAAQNRLYADVFDFGNLLHREYPHEWDSIKNDWNELFPYISIEATVSSQIKQSGMLSKSITD